MITIPTFGEMLTVAQSRGALSQAPGLWRDLAGFWPIMAGGGSTVHDVSGWGNHGTWVAGATPWAVGEFGICGEWTGETYYLTLGYSIPAASSGSMAAWVFPHRAWNSGASDPVVTESAGAVPEFSFMLHWTNDNLYSGFNNAGDDDRVVVAASATNWAQNTWQHYAMTWEHGGYTRLYRNAEEIGNNGGGTTVGSVSGGVEVGSYNTGANVFDGLISNMPIWSRALTASEIAYLYANRWDMLTLRRGAAVGSVTITGTVTWGHDTGVTETNVRDFSGNWTGTGSVSGAGDAEILSLDAGEYMESEVVNSGSETITVTKDKYGSGGMGTAGITVKYRTGATVAVCEAASWTAYSTPFSSLGYFQVRVEN